jgi:MFS family permease
MVALALTVLINYEKKKVKLNRGSGQEAPKLDIRKLFEKTALKPALYQLLMGFGSSVIYTFIPLYALARGVENIGLFFTLNAASGILASYLSGKLILKHGVRKIFFPALLMVLAGFILLAFATSLPLMLVAAVLYGIGNGIGFAIINIIGMELAPVQRRGSANATLYAAMDIGIASGSIILGFVAARFGFTATFLVAAAVIVLDLVLFTFLNKELPGYGNVIAGSHVIMMGTEEVNISTD